jgi:hypothetical protein
MKKNDIVDCVVAVWRTPRFETQRSFAGNERCVGQTRYRNEVKCMHDTSFGPAMQIRGYSTG